MVLLYRDAGVVTLGEVIVDHQLPKPRHNFVLDVKELGLHDWLLEGVLNRLESIFGLYIYVLHRIPASSNHLRMRHDLVLSSIHA
jgi:hypothetical protein